LLIGNKLKQVKLYELRLLFTQDFTGGGKIMEEGMLNKCNH